MSPEIVIPDLEIEFATITAIYDGTLVGGLELLPGSVVHVSPQVGTFELRVSANPLNESDAAPPVKVFILDHLAPHHVKSVVGEAAITVLSPKTNELFDNAAKTRTALESEDAL